MGFWGDSVFQSDRDLDLLSFLERDLQTWLYFPNEDIGRPATPEKFRDDEKAGKSAGDYDFGIGGGFHVAIVILGAAAMGVGAKIRDDDRAYMMQALKTRCFGMYDKEKKDIYQALEKYENNGKSVKISAPGLIETCETLPRHPHRIPGMINLPDPGMFAGHETVPLTM
ncbi:hypothetical protein BC567DRAFT_265098 [Phyllosticta citribraziliensis]